MMKPKLKVRQVILHVLLKILSISGYMIGTPYAKDRSRIFKRDSYKTATAAAILASLSELSDDNSVEKEIISDPDFITFKKMVKRYMEEGD